MSANNPNLQSDGLAQLARDEREIRLCLRERALHAVSNGIVIARCGVPECPIEYVNPAFERLTGLRAEGVVGHDALSLAAGALDDAAHAALADAIRARRAHTAVLARQDSDGQRRHVELGITPVDNELGEITHFIGVLTDVTQAYQRTRYLEHELTHDPLTGLANRKLLWERLEQALVVAQRNKSLVVVVLADLHGFKHINESWGHEAGDAVLKAVAGRLAEAARAADTVARLSADEFVLVLADQPSLRYAMRMIDRVHARLAQPVPYERASLPVAASVGVAVYPHDGGNAFDLVRCADIAMYHAKAAGGAKASFFSPDMKSTTESRHRLEAEMREALLHDEFFLVYQPRLSLRSGRVAGVEALLRWRHPQHGVLLPPSFLPEAEENGMAVPIGRWVFDEVCALMARLRDAGHGKLPVAMNASYRQFSEPNFVARVGEQLQRLGLAPDTLALELTEEALLRNRELSRELARQARALGLRLSIDHFGDGLTSLGELPSLAAANLTMTPGVVRDIVPDRAAAALTRALIDIAHNLDMTVVAASVETQGQTEFLRQHGCDEIQGHFYSGPLTAEALGALLEAEPH
ncbi:MAG: EAL domain-containing protein [Pseudomonadota bacterium]